MLSFRNLVNLIKFEYILYPLICCLFGLNEKENHIELKGGNRYGIFKCTF